MVELTVTVGILSALAGATLVGFGAFGDFIKAQEASGFTGDILRRSELSVLKEEAAKITVHFLTDYLVLEEAPAETGAVLTFDIADTCVESGSTGYFLAAGTDGVLVRLDEEDRLLENRAVTLGEKFCVAFEGAAEREWKFRLSGADGDSSLFRFIHFNLGTDFQLKIPQAITDSRCSLATTLAPGADVRLEIQAPYAKRQLYVMSVLESGSSALLLCGPSSDTGEFIYLQR